MSIDHIKKIVDDMFANKKIGKDDVKINGGVIKTDDISNFMNKWHDYDFTYFISENIDAANISETMPEYKDTKMFVRLRMFGEMGDLELWRLNETTICWRCLAYEDIPGGLESENFWAKNPNQQFWLSENQEMILWGKYDASRQKWHEDRVARANLRYPVTGNPERVKLVYRTLSYNGQISFVWYRKLKEA